MSYLDLFLRVARHLESQGVPVEFVRGRPLEDGTVEAARRALSLPLPDSLVEFYREVGDGMRFRWVAGEYVFSNLEFSHLINLPSEHEREKRSSVVFDEAYEWPYADRPRKAKRTARRMRQWLAFHHEGNGDRFCLDTAVRPEPVVFDRHDWMGSDDEDNGYVAGATLRSFMEAWSRVCFQFPSTLWWPSVLSERGVDWESGKFDSRFRLPGAPSAQE